MRPMNVRPEPVAVRDTSRIDVQTKTKESFEKFRIMNCRLAKIQSSKNWLVSALVKTKHQPTMTIQTNNEISFSCKKY